MKGMRNNEDKSGDNTGSERIKHIS